MGRHQRAETSGLISFLICAVVGAVSMNLYMEYAPAIWQLTQRRFMVCSGIVAACGVISFIIGYARKSRSLNLKHGWFAPIRRIFEIVALSVVYASTIFLSSFALIGAANDMMGNAIFSGYISSVCAAFAGVVGYMTFVQAEMMNAKTIASLLPFFVISGVVTAGMTTDDPYWYHNNFSQLGDRTTFAARMFNSTLILAGTCIIIVSYFAISELVTTERLQRLWHDRTNRDPNRGYEIPHFMLRISILSFLLMVAGLAFIGIGVFRYTPHNLLHEYMRQRPAVRHAAAVRAPAVACATPVQSSDGGLRPDRARMRCILGQYDDGSQHPHQCGGVGWSGVPRLVHRVLAPDRRHRGRSRGRSVVARAGHRRRF